MCDAERPLGQINYFRGACIICVIFTIISAAVVLLKLFCQYLAICRNNRAGYNRKPLGPGIPPIPSYRLQAFSAGRHETQHFAAGKFEFRLKHIFNHVRGNQPAAITLKLTPSSTSLTVKFFANILSTPWMN
jgi:hypothetical protein